MQNQNNLWQIFDHNFGDTGLIKGVFSAPGRVNLIGEHTDYNDGFVLPMAIENKITMFGQLRDDRQVCVFSLDYDTKTGFSLDNLFSNERDTWVNYLIGVFDEIKKEGYDIHGANLLFTGNIPQGAGLASSAALEAVTVLAVAELNRLKIEPVKMAYICKGAENNFVGVACGIMDQYISLLGRKDHALFIDCRTDVCTLVPLRNSSCQFVICDSKVQRKLFNSAYNKRKEECKKASDFFAAKLNHVVQTLRDVTIAEFKQYQGELPSLIARRARHVISENYRVQVGVSALMKGDFFKFGQLMAESHHSLKNNYEVSCTELDLLVDLAFKQKGVLGARMTGAGFGGCIVSLVEKEYIGDFQETICREYEKVIGIAPAIILSYAASGAATVELKDKQITNE